VARWDGTMRWIESLNPAKPYIWSSATLYDAAARTERENWFHQWIQGVAYPGTLDIIHFHQHGGRGNLFNSIRMNRDNQILTNSISSLCLTKEQLAFSYLDLITGCSGKSVYAVCKEAPVNTITG
jgi:hypothetical protein